MSALAAFLASFFSSTFALLVSWLGERGARIALALTVYLGALAALWAAIKGLAAGIAYVLPTTGLFHWFHMGIALALPDNFAVCSAAMLSTDAAVFLYRWNMNHVLDPKV